MGWWGVMSGSTGGRARACLMGGRGGGRELGRGAGGEKRRGGGASRRARWRWERWRWVVYHERAWALGWA